MKAIILAAGVGRRLSKVIHKPKSLLTFNGRSLMQRHLDNLAALGVTEVALCVGFEHEKILDQLVCPEGVSLCHRFNPDYREGSMISLWTMREDFDGNQDTLLMDADVLYERSILATLVNSPHSDLMLIDQDFEPGDEPVKICLLNQRVVEFRKQLPPDLSYDEIGESVGFFRFSPEMGQALIKSAQVYLDNGLREAPCEEAIRDVVLANQEQFEAANVSGRRWIEIDFPEDIARAEQEILPAVDR